MDKQGFIKAAGYKLDDYSGDIIYKDFKHGVMYVKASNKLKTSRDIIVLGVLMSRKCYTDKLILLEPELITKELFDNPDYFKEECNKATIMAINGYQESEMKLLRNEIKQLPMKFIHFHFMSIFRRIHQSVH